MTSAPQNSRALVPTAKRRRLSGMERCWLVADRLCPPFALQFVVEIAGEVSLDALRQATEAASRANPGAMRVLRGHVGWATWEVTELVPAVRQVDGSHWDGTGPEGAPFLDDPLDVRQRPGAEVLLATGKPLTRMVFRFHHALMDGGGGMRWIGDIFRALRQEACVGSADPDVIDADVARKLGAVAAEEPLAQYLAPTGVTDEANARRAWTWHRVSVAPVPRQVLPRTACALVDVARSLNSESGPLRLGIPVDWRRHHNLPSSTANLTGIIHIEDSEFMQSTDPVAAAGELLKARLATGQAGGTVLGAERLLWWPVSLLAWLAGGMDRRQRAGGRFTSSAALSNLGRIDLGDWSVPGAKASAAFWIPPPSTSLPLFLGMMGHQGGLELCGTMPGVLATGGRLEALLEGLKSELEAGVSAGRG